MNRLVSIEGSIGGILLCAPIGADPIASEGSEVVFQSQSKVWADHKVCCQDFCRLPIADQSQAEDRLLCFQSQSKDRVHGVIAIERLSWSQTMLTIRWPIVDCRLRSGPHSYVRHFIFYMFRKDFPFYLVFIFVLSFNIVFVVKFNICAVYI